MFGAGKKEKHSRPEKLSVCKIRGVSMANVDWCTSANDGASGVVSRVELINNLRSTTFDNYSDYIDS